MGFAFLKVQGESIVSTSYGVIRTNPKDSFIQKMLFIGNKLKELFDKYSPEILVVEKVFFGKDAKSAFKLGHTQCVCLYVAAERGIKTFEYATKEVKKTLTGSGQADKKDVRKMVLKILGGGVGEFEERENQNNQNFKMSLDASDAIALAYHHFLIWKNQNKRIKTGLYDCLS